MKGRRGFVKGEPRAPGAGRRAGTPNKIQRSIEELLMQEAERLGLEDYHPIKAMLGLAIDPEVPKPVRAKIQSEIIQYIAPKRRSIEHTGPDGGPIEAKINLVDEIVKQISEEE